MDYREFCEACGAELLARLREHGYAAENAYVTESDYAEAASTVAFALAKARGEKPADVARRAAGWLAGFPLAEVAAAGAYINFRAREPFYAEALRTVLRHGGAPDLPPAGEKVILEHTSANPTGPLHVGRGRNPIIGDSLARILRRAGYAVEVQYYVNDMGRQVATVVWGAGRFPRDADAVKGEKTDHRIVAIYRRATAELETHPELDGEVGEVLAAYEAGEPATVERFRGLVEACLEGQRQTLQRLNVSYDRFVWESELVRGGAVQEVLRMLDALAESREKDGARELDLSAFGLERPFVYTRSDGTTLYTTRDVAYHLEKLRDADRVVNVLGEDQKLAMEQLSATLRLCGQKRLPELVFYSFVKLPEGRMSTRRGTVVDLDDLLEEARARALAEVEKRRPEYPAEKKEEIAELVGMAAVRFDIARVAPDKGITFEWSRALDFEQQGAPFVQYSHARACSILRKAAESGLGFGGADPGLLVEPGERRLTLKLSKYGWVVEAAARDLRPNLVANYARELAEEFNAFYRDSPVLQAPAEVREARLLLVECSRLVLADALDCLGLTAPEEM